MADKPVTREEKYLAYLTGDYTGELPKPITRKEKYLYELCLKGMGGEVSPEEIKSAVNEYLEKNPVKPGATTEQAQQIEQNKTDIASLKTETSSLKEDLSNKITKFYASNQGKTHLQDSDNGKIMDMMIYGKSSQDGTPSPENPVEIKSVVNPSVKLSNEDGTQFKTVTLPYTLNAIPVTSGGNVIIDGQQYIADYVDVERGKLVKKLRSLTISDIGTVYTWGVNKNADNITGFYFFTSENGLPKSNNDVMTSTILRHTVGTWGGQNVGCAMSLDSQGHYVILSVPTNVLEDISSNKNACASLVKICENTNAIFFYSMMSPIETDLAPEEIAALKALATYYPTTNISINSEQLDGYTVFNYPISFEDAWNKTKKDVNSLKLDLTSKADKTSLAQTDRKLDALWKLNQGISYEFQTDDTEAYQKTVPSGVKLANVKSIGGKTIVWNQLADSSHISNWGETFIANKHYNQIENHMLYFRHKVKVKSVTIEQNTNMKEIIVFATTNKIIGHVDIKKDELKVGYENIVSTIEKMPKDITDISVYNCGNNSVGNTAECEVSIIAVDLTQMFGSGNEPSTPEEFEAMFQADYYPYNAGELMSAPVNEVAYSDTKTQETSYQIPQAILNLPGYGWSAGDVRNEVDWENKKYIQRVTAVDLGSLNYNSGEYETHKYFNTTNIAKLISPNTMNTLCKRYSHATANTMVKQENMEIVVDTKGQLFLRDDSMNQDATLLKDSLSGVALYYELAEPIITDLTDIISEGFLEAIEVETGGSLTFKNSHGDDYKIPVPSSEEYVISLAEVAK